MRRRYYIFGPYKLDPVARTVLHHDLPVPLTPKAVETLAVLVENKGQVVSKEMLLKRVWAATIVGDGSLMRNISDLRKALTADGQPDMIETVPKRGYRFTAPVEEIEEAPIQRHSVVVAPLRVIGADACDETMGVAIAEAVVTKLSAVRECTVQSAAAVGQRELRAEFVTDGSLRRSGNKIRVSVRLLPTSGASAVWSETLEELCDDLFACEDSISDELAGALALVLTGAERKLLARRYTEKLAAYQTYLKGRLQWASRSKDGLHRAIQYFRGATEIDPEYAPAHSALASSYALMPMIAPVASGEFMPRAKAAAVHALEIDDTLLEARSVLAFVKWHYDWNWSGAESEFKRILKFAPDDAVSRVWYALLLAERGECAKAVAEARRAQVLDPASASLRANVATVLQFCGRFDEALEEASNAVAADAGSLRAHVVRGLALEQKGAFAEAIGAFETAVAVSHGSNPTALGGLGHAFACIGNQAAAERVLRKLNEFADKVAGTPQAVIRVALGQKDEALRLLQRAVDSREFYLIMLGTDRRLDPIRHTSVFRDLLKTVGLAG